MMLKFLPLLRIIAFLEGVSYLLLLFIATPIKYFYNDPQYVKLLGMPHGILFMAYIIVVLIFSFGMQWNKKAMFMILTASVIPFGTFYIDKKYLNLKHG